LIPQSLRSLLGLCQRAGQAASGETAVEDALRRRKATLLFLADDASDNTRDRFTGLAARSGVRCYRVGTRDELGSALGKEHRATVAILSSDFAKGLTAILEREGLTPVEGRG